MTTPAPPTALADYVEALKRELAVPGEFATVFPNTQDSDLEAALGDAFGETQLDGFFGTMVLDPNLLTVTPGLSSGGAALVVIYAGIRSIRAQLRNMKTTQIYKAGGAEYEVQTAASVLTEELKDFRERKTNLLALVLRQARGNSAVQVSDGYLTRSRGYFPTGYFGEFGSFYGYEIAGFSTLIEF